jgi:hypothetical protein
MTFVAIVVRVLIASPSDLRDERDRVERTIHRWNALHAAHHGVVLLPVRWETNASAEMGGAAQDLINRQIVDESDVLVGMFWTRLGTPTASNVSGTAEELQHFLTAGKPAALFRSRRPADLETVDHEQFAALKAFLEEKREDGLVLDFDTPEELAALVEHSLTRIVRERFASASIPTSAPTPTLNADVRAEHMRFGRDHRVILRNVGSGEARRVTIETADADGGRGSWDLIQSDRPVDFLPPGGTYEYLAALDMGSPSRVNCTIRWINADDSEGSSRQSLSAF